MRTAMSEQSYESFQFERQIPFNAGFEDIPQDNYSFAFQREKLVVRKGSPL
jgi:hypothetical protein